jgi:hypothetical protein
VLHLISHFFDLLPCSMQFHGDNHLSGPLNLFSSPNRRPKISRSRSFILKQKTHPACEWVESFFRLLRLQRRPPPPGWMPSKSIPAKQFGVTRIHDLPSLV